MRRKLLLTLFVCLTLAACGGKKTVKPAARPAPPVTSSKPTPTAPTTSQPATTTASPSVSTTKPGGYYLDDGPEANPPGNLDEIPDAIPKIEPLLDRANKPYKALGEIYTPMTTSQSYKVRGVASWYGKRFHGKKTSSGEVYDMYAMTAAHTILPLPSYAKVTNPANNRSVIVRINDRGPFKHSRVIDLSYAAAYKLRLINQGSGLVEVEAIHPDQIASNNIPATSSSDSSEPALKAEPVSAPEDKLATMADTKSVVASPPVAEIKTEMTGISPTTPSSNSVATFESYFVQAGAFKNEVNAQMLMKKIQGLDIEQNVGINSVYNNGLHRLKLGPYDTRSSAEQAAMTLRKRLNIPTLITNQ